MIAFTALPFDEAIAFFRDKVPLTPDQFNKLAADARAKAFTVSGVARMDVITDLHAAIDRAITDGTTFTTFKKDIKGIMEKRGWEGASPHRLDTIFRTNIQDAYQAGHYRNQMELTDSRPYWQYMAVMDVRVRPAHRAMNGKVMRYDDPFWKTSYPPNGFNCRCTVRSLSQTELDREGLSVERNPGGIADPGFDHVPGELAWRESLAKRGIDNAERETWRPLVIAGAREAGRSEKIPYDPLPEALGPTLKELGGDKEKLRSLYREAIGGENVTIETPDKDSLVLSGYLFDHMTFDGREAYFPLIGHVLREPYEIWLMPMKGETSGRIVMRKRFIRFFEDEEKHRVMLTAEYQQGAFVGYTFFRGDKEGYFLNQRKGLFLYGR